jgi:hypothetical protein
MSDNNKDLALEVLISVWQESHSGLPMNLIKSIYQLEKANQFNQTRDLFNSIEKLIDEEITNNPTSWSSQ